MTTARLLALLTAQRQRRLSTDQLRALAVLAMAGGREQLSEVAAELSLGPEATLDLALGLEQAGLAVREPVRNNRRAWWLVTTPRGTATVNSLQALA